MPEGWTFVEESCRQLAVGPRENTQLLLAKVPKRLDSLGQLDPSQVLTVAHGDAGSGACPA